MVARLQIEPHNECWRNVNCMGQRVDLRGQQSYEHQGERWRTHLYSDEVQHALPIALFSRCLLSTNSVLQSFVSMVSSMLL